MKTEHRCTECSAFCSESFGNAWLVCPRCSRTCRDFKPQDFHPAGDWDFPDVDGVELAETSRSYSLIEHAFEA